MIQFKDMSIADFQRSKAVPKNNLRQQQSRVTFYKTKPGCYTPPSYELKYRKLSDVI